MELIGDSPISIVAEVLSLYDTNQIGTKNIDLKAKIIKTDEQIKKYEQYIDSSTKSKLLSKNEFYKNFIC